MRAYGVPAIFNTDQGAQFTSPSFTGVLKEAAVRISMDGKNRAIDNIVVERFWRSLKYEEIYLKDYADVNECRLSINNYVASYNSFRPHQSLEHVVPDTVYESGLRSLVDEIGHANFLKNVS
jgi:putative transposase